MKKLDILISFKIETKKTGEWTNYKIKPEIFGKNVLINFSFSDLQGRLAFSKDLMPKLKNSKELWNQLFELLELKTSVQEQLEIYEVWKEKAGPELASKNRFIRV